MREKVARILGVKARFATLWPSDQTKDALCPFTMVSPLRSAWEQGWKEADRIVRPLDEHRAGAMGLYCDSMGDFLTVRLESYGNSKISVIKAVRALTSMGLREAKQLVESAPCSFGHYPEAEAVEVAATLREAGAQVSLPSAIEKLASLAMED